MSIQRPPKSRGALQLQGHLISSHLVSSFVVVLQIVGKVVFFFYIKSDYYCIQISSATSFLHATEQYAIVSDGVVKITKSTTAATAWQSTYRLMIDVVSCVIMQ